MRPALALLLLSLIAFAPQVLFAEWRGTEAHRVEIAREMHESGDWMVPTFGNQPTFAKPPLYYWLAAAGGWLSSGRVTEALARLPSALAGVSVVLVCVPFGRALFGTVAPGHWAGAGLLSTWFFAHLARRAQLDVVLTLFETLALLAFWRMDSGATRRGPGTIALLHAAMGLAALTKGPVGWIPLLIIGAYLGWERRLTDLDQSDVFRDVTGRSAIDNAIRSTRRMMDTFNRLITDTQKDLGEGDLEQDLMIAADVEQVDDLPGRLAGEERLGLGLRGTGGGGRAPRD